MSAMSDMGSLLIEFDDVDSDPEPVSVPSDSGIISNPNVAYTSSVNVETYNPLHLAQLKSKSISSKTASSGKPQQVPCSRTGQSYGYSSPLQSKMNSFSGHDGPDRGSLHSSQSSSSRLST